MKCGRASGRLVSLKGSRVAISWLLAGTLWLVSPANSQQTPQKFDSANTSGYVGNQPCLQCHESISTSFAQTAHAHASGLAGDNFIAGEFKHSASRSDYKVYAQDGKVWMSFEKTGDPLVQGKRQLLYYIGQGRRGTTYLFSVDGYYFETPINLYTSRHIWDMAPAYGNASQIPLGLPVLPSCMECHVSGMRPPMQGTENRYAAPLFLFAGVTCERCHGPAEAHAKNGSAAIVNPAKLKPERRDQVCMQCHLEGDAAIVRSGEHLYEYKPGDNLFDFVRYYVLTESQKPGLRATSQFEQLALSKCKKKSGDAMSCTSCHDPHRTIPASERVAYYRSKCLACHGNEFGEKHHAAQPDCTQCHMPANASSNIAHTAVTDHSIPRHAAHAPAGQGVSVSGMPQLVPFPSTETGGEKDVRDLALAWQSIAVEVNDGAQEAERLLRQAAVRFPNDPEVLAALAFDEQQQGAKDKARQLYNRALSLDPELIEAETNLGVLDAQTGDLRDAVRLWQDAFQRAPSRSEIGIDLARAFCAERQFSEARDYTLRVLEFNPDSAEAKTILKDLNSNRPRCGG
jgi:tetratricopeptide (TPR) repeat protein